MTTLRKHASGLEAGRPRTDHDGLAADLRLGDLVRDFPFTTGRGIVDTECLPAFIDPVETVSSADTGPDACLLAALDLSHYMRVGDMGARHADHVELPLGDRMTGGCYVTDARGVEDRKFGYRPHFAGKIEMRGRCHALDRDDLVERDIAVDMA